MANCKEKTHQWLKEMPTPKRTLFRWSQIQRPIILYFRIPHNTLCLPSQILHKPLFWNAPGSTAFSQEHLKTITYAKFGGQTECIMGDSKIVNERQSKTIFGFWIPHRGFRTTGTGLQILWQWNLDSGFQSLVGSGLLQPCSRFQSPGFRILQEKFPGVRIPDSLTRGYNEILIQPKIQPPTLLP